MISIIIKDGFKREYEILTNLQDELEKHIANNINIYNDKYPDHIIAIETLHTSFNVQSSIFAKWTLNQALYDNLILKYNNDPTNTDILDRWIKV
ncbi:hypothetical protein [Chryseobacterium arthrosphaerae]|uniref:hypothetical protein n=1 Tax=Chryseobacterium arthrosphaerae TaxID=651561 RepID=UPI003D328C56